MADDISIVQVPESLCRNKCPELSGKLRDLAACYWDTIVKKASQSCERAFAPIAHTRFRVYDSRYKPTLRALTDHEFIEVDGSYWPDHFSKSYRPHPRLDGEALVNYRLKTPRIIEKRRRLFEIGRAINEHRTCPWYREQLKYLARLQLDDKAVRQAIIDRHNPYSHRSMLALVDRVEHRSHWLKIAKTGRLFSAAGFLPSHTRRFWTIDGEPLVGLDIRNSQIAELGWMLSRPYNENRELLIQGLCEFGVPQSRCSDTCSGRDDCKGKRPMELCSDTARLLYGDPKSLEAVVSSSCNLMFELSQILNSELPSWDSDGRNRFIEDAASGRFYDQLVNQLKLEGPDARTEVKREVLRDLLAHKGNYPARVQTAASHRYPGIGQWLKRINGNDHTRLICHLQRLETLKVMHMLLPHVLRKQAEHTQAPWAMTNHDAIYVRKSDMDISRSAIKEVFDALGYQADLKIDDFHKA